MQLHYNIVGIVPGHDCCANQGQPFGTRPLNNRDYQWLLAFYDDSDDFDTGMI